MDKPGALIEHDVVVVGGGAAGLSAALVLGRARRRVVLVDAGAPRNAPAEHMHGFVSRDGMPPREFLATGRLELRRYDVKILQDKVDKVEAGFSVRLVSGSKLRSRTLVVATGASDELPELPGIRERWGRDLLHCPYCHGWEVRDQPLGVLGSHPAAVDHALLVRQWSPDIIFFAHTQALSEENRVHLHSRRIRIVEGEVARLVVEDDRLIGVELADGRLIARAAIFVRTRNKPHSIHLLSDLGCELTEEGFASVDELGRTTVQGVWAAGNVVNPRAQVISCAGAGSSAAIALNAELVHADVDRALNHKVVVPHPA